MATFSYVPSYSSAVKRKPRTLKAQFGDGYAQRAADGVNNKPRMWSLKFDVPLATADTIDAFFVTHDGRTPFDWTPPIGAAGKFVCEEWNRSLDTYGTHVITATFEEDFAP